MNKIVILGLLGDPFLKPGSIHAGGLNKTVSELLNFLITTNLDVVFITTTFDTDDSCELITDHFTLAKISISEEEYINQDILVERKNYFYAKIKNILKKDINKINIIHSLYWFSGLFAYYLNRDFNIQYIHSVISCAEEKLHTNQSLKSKYQLNIERNIFKNAKYILSITNSEKRNLITYYNVPNKKIIIVGRTVDKYFDFQYKNKKKNNVKSICLSNKDNCYWNYTGAFTYFGRIVDIKGISQIILAWENIYLKYQEETPPLWIVGGDSQTIYKFRNSLLNKLPNLEKYEKEHKLYWWGLLDSYGIASLLQKTIVVIMHSKHEAGGRVMIESMKTGIPVIGTKVGFCNDYIKNWYNGYLIEFNDINSLSFCMSLFIKNPFLSNNLGRNAKYTVDQLEKQWDYFNTHFQLYTNLDNFYKNTNAFLEKSNCKSNKIDIFPYNDIKAELSLSEFKLNKNSYLWFDKQNNVYIKQYFNRLNYLSFIFDSESKIHSVFELFSSSIASAKYQNILSISNVDNNQLFYTMEAHKLLQIDFSFLINSNMIKEFNKNKRNNDTFLVNNIYTDFTKLLNTIITLDKGNSILNINLKKILIDILESHSHLELGLNYGKTFINHIVKVNKNQFALLPTSTCFYGVLGFDEAVTTIDLSNNDVEYKEMLINLKKQYFQAYLWMAIVLSIGQIMNRYLFINEKISDSMINIYIDTYTFNIK